MKNSVKNENKYFRLISVLLIAGSTLISGCDNAGSDSENAPQKPSTPGVTAPQNPTLPDIQLPPALPPTLPEHPDFPDIDMDPENPDVPQSSCKGDSFSSARSALSQRNAGLATEKQLVDFSLCLIKGFNDATKQKKENAIKLLYKGLGDTYSWDPGKGSQTLKSMSPLTWPVLLSNVDGNGTSLSEINKKYALIQAGERKGQRYIFFGGGITRFPEQYKLMDNAVSWLTENNIIKRNTYKLAQKDSPVMNVVVTQPSDNYYDDYSDIVKWLDSEYPGSYKINDKGTCDYSELIECLKPNDTDLIIFGGFELDPSKGGYKSIKNGIQYAIINKIPVMSISHGDIQYMDMQNGFYSQYDVVSYNNYFYRYKAVDVPIVEHLKDEPYVEGLPRLYSNLENNVFSSSMLPEDCDNVSYCHSPIFDEEFRNGADFYRDLLIQQDLKNVDVLSDDPLSGLLSAGLLLADKYRQLIDYPIKSDDNPGPFIHALFADWVVNYARVDNISQPDLGTIVQDKSNVLNGSLSTYEKTTTGNYKNVEIKVISPNQWTTSGWYAQPGDKITIKSESSDNPSVYIQLGYKRVNTTRIGSDKTYLEPVDFSMNDLQRIPLRPGEQISFSTPYGDPIYIHFDDPTKTKVLLSAINVAHHPALLDVNDSDEINAFDSLTKSNGLPHVDVVVDEGTEIHARRDRILQKMNDDIYDTRSLINAYKNYLHWFNSLGGFKETGKPLEETLTPGDLSTCENIFGVDDCTDEKLHSKSFIQHANFDQYANCSIGCGGNPFDSSGWANPYGWLINHEEGHNLQINKLNVQYVPRDQKDLWTKYSSRAAENSNNIFPYYNMWKFNNMDGRKSPPIEGEAHFTSVDVYSVVMSELRHLTDDNGNPVIYDRDCTPYSVTEGTPVSRYTAPWQANDYAIYNSYRMAFYIQMAFQADKMSMRGGGKLTSGFDIFTLLYQHARIFEKYANSNDWENHKDALGFSRFPYDGDATYGGNNVNSIRGNDFMLVSLSYITNHDWRPYFDMFGLSYSNLASQQVDANGFSDLVKQIIWVDTKDPGAIPDSEFSADPDLITLDMTDKNSELPTKMPSCLLPQKIK